MDTNAKIIKLVELANTWQGEGPDTGRQMMIARFKHCNKHCKFCDTWIKMKTSAEGSYSIDDINMELIKTRGLMITGGEPTFVTPQGSIDNLSQTFMMLDMCEYQLANVETNGFKLEELVNHINKNISNSNKIVHVMYSPKIFSADDYELELENVDIALRTPFVFIKVVADKTEITEKFIRTISEMTGNRNKIYLMPLGVTQEEIAKNWDYCIDLADECNVNISTRMHIMNQFT